MPLSIKSLLDNLSYVPSSKPGTKKPTSATLSSNESDSPRVSTPRIIRRVSNVLDYAAKKDVTSMTAKKNDAAANRRESDTSLNDSFKASGKVENQAINNSQRRTSSLLETSSRSLVESDTSLNESDLSCSFKASVKVEGQAIQNSQRRKSSFLDTSSRSLDAPTKRVSFTQHSKVKVYEVNRAHRKSYTSEDEQGFKVEAYIDALRIREAIASHPDASVKNPIKNLIELNLLSAEELVGLEHKISDVSGKKKAVEMSAHAAFLLEVQEEMRKKNQEIDVEKLAAAASISSSKSTRKARARAALAA